MIFLSNFGSFSRYTAPNALLTLLTDKNNLQRME